MVVFDTTFLLHLIDPNASPPLNPSSGQPVTHAYQRIRRLVSSPNDGHDKIIIPTPALAELLIIAEKAGSKYLDNFTRAAVFQVESFDVRAAVELAIMTAKDIKDGDKRAGSTATMAKLKFDRQIVAIAKVNGGSTIYTNDEYLMKFARARDVETVALWDLPLPPEDAQIDWLAQSEMAEAPEPEPETEDQNQEDEGEE